MSPLAPAGGHVSGNLRYLRRMALLSQDELAEAVGVSRRMYHRYESGSSQVPMDILQVLSELFHVSLQDLMERDLTAPPDPAGVEALCDQYKSLSVISRKVIMEEIYLLQELESRLYGDGPAGADENE